MRFHLTNVVRLEQFANHSLYLLWNSSLTMSGLTLSFYKCLLLPPFLRRQPSLSVCMGKLRWQPQSGYLVRLVHRQTGCALPWGSFFRVHCTKRGWINPLKGLFTIFLSIVRLSQGPMAPRVEVPCAASPGPLRRESRSLVIKGPGLESRSWGQNENPRFER